VKGETRLLAQHHADANVVIDELTYTQKSWSNSLGGPQCARNLAVACKLSAFVASHDIFQPRHPNNYVASKLLASLQHCHLNLSQCLFLMLANEGNYGMNYLVLVTLTNKL
jgi:hypothetical protein